MKWLPFPSSFHWAAIIPRPPIPPSTTVSYRWRDKCRLGSFGGPLNYIKGKAKAVDNTNAKLNVTFVNTFGPGSNYWIIELASDYSYSVVSDPSRNTLFILSRTPRMSNVLLEDIFERLEMMGFDVTRIKMTPQNG